MFTTLKLFLVFGFALMLYLVIIVVIDIMEARKDRRFIRALRETTRRLNVANLNSNPMSSELLVETSSPSRGPEIPGMTQIEPGVYVANKLHSVFKK